MESNLAKFNKISKNENILKIKTYANLYEIPIISEEGLAFLNQMIRVSKAKRILEIGTAIGYSAINMALLSDDITVDTIERNPKMYEEAKANIAFCNLDQRINVFFADALEIDLSILQKEYDLIFIDAAKAQYTKFFGKFSNLLSSEGIIISDNLMFHGLVESEQKIESRNLRALVRKIHNYNLWLSENPNYHSLFLEIGDGMALSKRK